MGRASLSPWFFASRPGMLYHVARGGKTMNRALPAGKHRQERSFFSKLKEHGIYIYFQLNISRKFGEENGIVNAKQLPYFYHGIDKHTHNSMRFA